MRVVFDTNVLASAFTSLGLCHEVYERALIAADIIAAERLLAELRRALADKMKIEKSCADEIIVAVRDEVEMVEPIPLAERVCRDADDDWVLAIALTGKSGVIVTGDKDLLSLKEFQGIKIFSPRQFVEWMAGQK